MAAPPVVAALPTAPNRNDAPADFSTKADAFVAALPPMVTAENALATWMNTTATEVAGSATAAAGSATAAAGSAVAAAAQVTLAAAQVTLANTAREGAEDAEASALAYAQAAGAASGIPTAVPDSILSTDASGIVFWGKSGLNRSARTSAVTLTADDRGKLVDITSGSFTQSFSAAATLGAGWLCYLQNSGTGDITLDPNASETIDGLTSFVMYPGETRIIQCDGLAFRSIVMSPFSKVFIASGNFIKPPGYKQFGGILWSGGGSGRKGTTGDSYGGTGSAGVPFTLPDTALLSSNTVVIGAGGAPVTASNVNGVAGGQSTFMGLYCGPGRAGTTGAGVGGDAYKLQATNPALTGAQMNIGDGLYGGAGARSNVGGLQYGDTVFGGAAGNWIISSVVNTSPSITVFGGAGGTASLSSSGGDGVAPGGGGGATQTGPQSGAGARGELRIWGIA